MWNCISPLYLTCVCTQNTANNEARPRDSEEADLANAHVCVVSEVPTRYIQLYAAVIAGQRSAGHVTFPLLQLYIGSDIATSARATRAHISIILIHGSLATPSRWQGHVGKAQREGCATL